MKYLNKTLLTLFFLSVTFLSYASEKVEPSVLFNFKHVEHRVSVQYSATDTGKADILLSVANQEPSNLSIHLPGNNIDPIVSLSPAGDRFVVSWFQDHFNNKQLCYYDSETQSSQKLQLESYKTAYPLEMIFYQDQPFILIFKGNCTNQTDLFYYHLATGEVVNITHSPDQDLMWKIFDEENRVFIETKSLYRQFRYRLRKRDLQVKLLESIDLPQEKLERHVVKSDRAINTIAAFGDSITWGTIRMDPDNPDDEEHPESAYLAQLEDMLEAGYGEVYTDNLGNPGDTSFDAVDRMEDAFDRVDAYYCIVLLGTNDVAEGKFDVDETIENLFYIASHLIDDYGMLPILSRIPPQKNELKYPAGQQVYVLNTIALNARLEIMARDMGLPLIDAHHMFFNSGTYWEDLLEAYKGNHPNPDGHLILAELFKEKILAVPPAVPQQFFETETTSDAITLQWTYNQEFDFSHYIMQWGYSSENLDHTETVTDSYFRFVPDKTDENYNNFIYMRIQAVDKDGNSSAFSAINTMQFN